eukprot:TRINITY_DN310_c0_g1_i2.p1 TRINITY_DN310_c0_g1~~TRINITY_DN310_c0_g1_i2.p1  ORF type:complete len:3659 (-),score=1079.82 TRINITY_DN310_c0_g1_i2:58-10971(-)
MGMHWLLCVATIALVLQGLEAEEIAKRFEIGNALSFDGSNDFVKLPNTIVLGAPLTIEAIIRSRGDGPFLSFGPPEYELTFSMVSSKVRVTAAKPRSPSYLGNQVANLTSTTGLANNTWSYIVITVASNGVVKIYLEVDDVMNTIGSGTIAVVPQALTRTSNCVGKTCLATTPQYFKGDLDEIRVWSRTIQFFEMTRNRPIDIDDTTLVGYWDFDEGVGKLVKDSSRNLFDGSLGDSVVAESPTWIVSGYLTTSTCTLFGDPTIRTYDKFAYRINITGQYWLSVPSPGPSVLRLQVAVAVSTGVPITRTITGVAFQTSSGDHVIVDLDFRTKSNSILYVNGEAVWTDSLSYPTGLSITRAYLSDRHTYTINVPYEFSMSIIAQPSLTYNEVNLRVPTFINGGIIGGLCGNMNGDQEDEFGAFMDWAVLPQDNLFLAPAEQDGMSTEFKCNITLSEINNATKKRAFEICQNPNIVHPSLESACLKDICVTGDVRMAMASASLTYSDCVEEASNNNGTKNCTKPCPNFCSFNGNCSAAGVCSCFSGYSGLDCSQPLEFDCFQVRSAGRVQQLIPFGDTKYVAEHYAYSTAYDDSSNTGFEVSNTALMYLYEQRGFNFFPLTSLVFILDKVRDGSNGTAEVDFVYDPAPNTVFLQVADDLSGPSADNFTGAITFPLTGKMNAKFKWDRCCTDGLVLGPLSVFGDFCLNITLKSSTGIDQIAVSNENFLGTQDLFRITETNTVGICGSTCQNPCAALKTCGQCAADSRCGWCADTKTCDAGDQGGPSRGRCKAWRYSTSNNVSRVVGSNIDYPVDPSQVSVYMAPGSDLTTSFYMNFPANVYAPLEVVILQDLTASFGSDLSTIKSVLNSLVSNVKQVYPNAKFGVASFSDKPISPYGSAAQADFAYQVNLPITSNQVALQAAIDGLVIRYGGDALNSQLEALYQLALSSSIAWSSKATRVVLLVTKSGFHVPPSTAAGITRPNTLDNEVNADEDYPYPNDVRAALLSRNIVPVFVAPAASTGTTPPIVKFYQDLVASWGFGVANVMSDANIASAFSQAIDSLQAITSSARVVATSSDIAITPSTGYVGISPETRVKFDARIAAGATLPATLTIPGFGQVQFVRAANDAPTGSCQATNIPAVAGFSVIDLNAGSTYSGVGLTAKIVELPSPTVARLYQYTNGGKGTQIAVNDVVTDPLMQIYAETVGAGTATFKFKVYDDCDACSEAISCSVITTKNNQAPVALLTTASADEDHNTTITLLATDVDDTVLLYRVEDLPPTTAGVLYRSSGVPIVAGEQVTNPLVFAPARDMFGSNTENLLATFGFSVTDPQGLKAYGTVKLIVRPVPDAPTASAASVSISEDSVGGIDLNGVDAFGETPSVLLQRRLISYPQHGVLLPCGNNSCSAFASGPFPLLITGQKIFYKPNADYYGSDSFKFQVVDEQGMTSSDATISITVDNVNDAPTTADVFSSVDEDSLVTITLSGSDIDNTAQSLRATICNWNGAGTLYEFGTNTQIPHGADYVVLNAERKVDYRPPANAFSVPAGTPFTSFTFRIRDPAGAVSPCATAAIEVKSVNDLPVTVPHPQITTNEDEAVLFSLKATDEDTADHPLTFSVCVAPTKGRLQVGGVDVNVNASLASTYVPPTDSQLAVTYVPNFNANGADSFSYKVTDGHATSVCDVVSIAIAAVNDAPFAIADFKEINEDTDATFTLAGTDPEQSALTFAIVKLPTAGTLFNMPSHVAIQQADLPFVVSTAQVQYRPAANGFGQVGLAYDTFEFVARDSAPLSSEPATITIFVLPVNDPPVAESFAVVTPEDVPLIINLGGTDIEDDAADLTVEISSLITRGYLKACSNENCTTTTAISQGVALPTAYVLFSTDLDANDGGNGLFATFSYIVRDTAGLPSGPAQVSIGVTPVNDAPVARSAVITIYEDTSATIYLNGTDPDGDALTAIILTWNGVGSLHRLPTDQIIAPGSSDVQLDTRSVKFTPPMYTYSEVVPLVSFSFRLVDTSGVSSDPQTVEIYVLHVNHPPTAVAATEIFTNETTPAQITLGGQDVDVIDHPLKFFICTLPSGAAGVLSQNGSPVSAGVQLSASQTVATTSQASLVFTPANNVDTWFSYYVSDGQNRTDCLRINITVANVNKPPTANSQNATALEDTPLPITLTFSDDVGVVSLVIVTKPARGTLKIDGTPVNLVPVTISPTAAVVFEPATNENGAGYASFNFKAVDADDLASNLATVAISVTPVNDAPTATPMKVFSTPNLQPLVINLAGTDVEDAPADLKVFVASGPSGNLYTCTVADPSCPAPRISVGSEFVLAPQKRIYFEPTIWDPTSFRFFVQDTEGANSTERTVSVTVFDPNRAPTATSGRLQHNEDTNVTITAQGSDLDNDDLTTIICAWNGTGDLYSLPSVTLIPKVPGSVLESNKLVYVPPPNYSGSNTFTFKVRDTHLAYSQCVSVSITTKAVNDPPNTVPAIIAATENVATAFQLFGEDVDTTPLAILVCSLPTKGVIISNGAPVQINASLPTSTVTSTRTAVNLIYEPFAQQFGADTFTYLVSDGALKTSCDVVTINIAKVNDAPVAYDQVATTDEDTNVTVTLNATDIDNDPLTFAIFGVPTLGKLFALPSLVQITTANVPFNLGGNMVLYSPPANGFGEPLDSFAFVAQDLTESSLVHVMKINVRPVNDPPVAQHQAVTTDEDVSLAISLGGNDVEDASSVLRVVITSAITRGVLRACLDENCATTQAITLNTVLPTRTVKFTPPLNENDPQNIFATFNFKVRDSVGADSQSVSVDIRVSPVDDPPVVSPCAVDFVAVNDQPVQLCFGAEDPDGPFPVPTYVVISDFVGALYQYENGNLGRQLTTSDNLVEDPSGRLFYINEGYLREERATQERVTYYVRNSNGEGSNTTISIQLTFVNAPAGTTEYAAGTEDTDLRIELHGTDVDHPNATLSATIAYLPAKGKLFQMNGTEITTVPTLVTDPSNSVLFRPLQDQNGVNYTHFGYIISSSEMAQQSPTTAVSIDIAPVNDPPMTITTQIPCIEDTPMTIKLEFYDPDLENEGDHHYFYIGSVGFFEYQGKFYDVFPNGSIGANIIGLVNLSNSDGFIHYIPAADEYGQARTDLNWAVIDSYGRPSNAHAYVNIENVNDAPTCGNFVFEGNNDLGAFMNEYLLRDMDLLRGPVAERPQPLAVTFLDPPENGTLYIHGETALGPETGVPIIWGGAFNYTDAYIQSLNMEYVSNVQVFSYYTNVFGSWGAPYDHWKIRVFDGITYVDCSLTANIKYVNTVPTFNGTTVWDVNEATDGTSTSINITLSASDPDLGRLDLPPQVISFEVVSVPNHGRLWTYSLGGDLTTLDSSYFPINLGTGADNNILRYEPHDDSNLVNTGGVDSFVVVASDNFRANPVTTTIYVQVQPVNSVPKVSKCCVSTTEILTDPDAPTCVVADRTKIYYLRYYAVADDIVEGGSGGLMTTTINTLGDADYEVSKAEMNRSAYASGIFNMSGTGSLFSFKSSLATLNQFLQNIPIVPLVPYANGAAGKTKNFTIIVSDTGNFGTGGVKNVTIRSKLCLKGGTSGKGGSTANGAASGFVAVTTAMALGIFSIYKILKHKKIIPEDVDPWENDEVFDVTLDNPLFSGNPDILEPVYE